MDYIVHEILQARILEWVAVPFSRGSSQARDWTQVSRIAGRCFTSWATRETNKQKGTHQGLSPEKVLPDPCPLGTHSNISQGISFLYDPHVFFKLLLLCWNLEKWVQCESLGSPQLPGSPRCKPAGVQSQTLWGKQGVIFLVGFLGGTSGKEPTSQLRRHKGCGFNLWFGKIPWRSLVGYSPEARRVGHDWSDLAHTRASSWYKSSRLGSTVWHSNPSVFREGLCGCDIPLTCMLPHWRRGFWIDCSS